ncbi:MAG: hypothetical protein HQ522_05745 [Bacteroidetes bacterium]|nr:hypothetical protein [Bacteroidota bacterium]
MQEKYKYRYNHEEQILYKFYYGAISLEEIKSSWIHAFENNLIPKETKGFILDYRKATFDMRINEYPGISDFYKDNLAVFRNKKIGILSDKPETVVVVMMVESKDDGYYSRPFSTLEAAKAWVLDKYL